jgi:hypothetical protein
MGCSQAAKVAAAVLKPKNFKKSRRLVVESLLLASDKNTSTGMS